jgi:hypothetical protein
MTAMSQNGLSIRKLSRSPLILTPLPEMTADRLEEAIAVGEAPRSSKIADELPLPWGEGWGEGISI